MAAGKTESHGAKAPRSNQGPGRFVVVILRFPHLMLTNVCAHDGVTAGQAPDVIDDMGRIEVPVIR